MSKYLKLIWFTGYRWTKFHAAIGIKAEKAICGAIRSTSPILPSKKFPFHRSITTANTTRCLRCLSALRKKYGTEDIAEVKVK